MHIMRTLLIKKIQCHCVEFCFVRPILVYTQLTIVSSQSPPQTSSKNIFCNFERHIGEFDATGSNAPQCAVKIHCVY